MSTSNKILALDLLSGYNGNNPYILMLKRDVFIKKEEISDFSIEYILKNHNFQPIQINKTIKIADWYKEKKKKRLEFRIFPRKTFRKMVIR